MLKERIQEIFEFTKSESPYKKANKGWINQDIFLDLSPSSNAAKQKNEDAKVTFLWSPINNLLSNIFLIIIIGSLLVFTSLSFVKGRINSNIFNNSTMKNIRNVELNQIENINKVESSDPIDTEIKNKFDLNELNKSIKTNISDENEINIDQKIIKNKIEEKKNIIKDSEPEKNIQILKNKKSKSNFI